MQSIGLLSSSLILEPCTLSLAPEYSAFGLRSSVFSLKRRIIRIPLWSRCVKGGVVPFIPFCALGNASNQIGISEECFAECHSVGTAFFNYASGAFGVKAAVDNHFALVARTEMFGDF